LAEDVAAAEAAFAVEFECIEDPVVVGQVFDAPSPPLSAQPSAPSPSRPPVAPLIFEDGIDSESIASDDDDDDGDSISREDETRGDSESISKEDEVGR